MSRNKHTKHKGDKKRNKKFWNKQYDNASDGALRISREPSADLIRFLKWVDKYTQENFDAVELGEGSVVYDIGCGNGRNLIYLAREFGMEGSGFDISAEAIDDARAQSADLPLEYEVREMSGEIPLPDNSVDLVLDMMASHFLNENGREELRREIARVLKPGGWLFYKTFLLDGDLNAKRMLKQYPGNEPGSYIHPQMKVQEHVSTFNEIIDAYAPYFTIHKMLKSHNHIKSGRANKRRSVVAYCENTKSQ